MADGIGKFEKSQFINELQRIKRICNGSIPGIISNQLTRSDIDKLQSNAMSTRNRPPTSLKDYTETIYVNGSWLHGPWATKARRYVRTQGLQGRCSSVYTRWIIRANFND